MGNRDMSAPVSAVVTGAEVVLMPGIEQIRSQNPRKGSITTSIRSVSASMAGHHKSAGRTKSTRTRPGNPYLKAVLGTSAMNASRNKNSHLGARYRRLAARRSKGNALVAIQHTILVAIWHLAQTGALSDDLGADHYTRIEPIRTLRRAIRQLEQLGYTVTLQPAS